MLRYDTQHAYETNVSLYFVSALQVTPTKNSTFDKIHGICLIQNSYQGSKNPKTSYEIHELKFYNVYEQNSILTSVCKC